MLALAKVETFKWTAADARLTGLNRPITFRVRQNGPLFFLSLLNLLLKRFFPQEALSQAELLLVYSMLSVTSAIGGHSFMEILRENIESRNSPKEN